MTASLYKLRVTCLLQLYYQKPYVHIDYNEVRMPHNCTDYDELVLYNAIYLYKYSIVALFNKKNYHKC